MSSTSTAALEYNTNGELTIKNRQNESTGTSIKFNTDPLNSSILNINDNNQDIVKIDKNQLKINYLSDLDSSTEKPKNILINRDGITIDSGSGNLTLKNSTNNNIQLSSNNISFSKDTSTLMTINDNVNISNLKIGDSDEITSIQKGFNNNDSIPSLGFLNNRIPIDFYLRNSDDKNSFYIIFKNGTAETEKNCYGIKVSTSGTIESYTGYIDDKNGKLTDTKPTSSTV